MRLLTLLLPLCLGASACAPGDSAEGRAPGSVHVPPSGGPAAMELPREWRTAPAEGVQVREGEALVVETGPHAVLWPAGAEALEPPYTIRARMRKPTGRLHEGYGIVIGGAPLDAPEEAQRYSYFLVRGDGSFLIKRRVGPETPVVRPWTFHPAIRRDTEEGGETNELAVRVGTENVVFLVNGVEVARVPASELDTRGIAGVRVAHDIRLVLAGFDVEPGPAGEPSGP